MPLFKRDIELIQDPNTRSIDLTGDLGLNDADAIELAELLKADPHVTKVDLYRNNIGDNGAIALADLTSVSDLNLGYNMIFDRGALALVKNPHIKKLTLSRSGISEAGGQEIAEVAMQFELDVSCGMVSKETQEAIQKRVATNYEKEHSDDEHCNGTTQANGALFGMKR